MKKIEENRYPHAAALFKFCKQALELRYQGNVKVIDQDVGAILGYDPADCSHWKKGKKNIRALATLKNIADHLNVDERLLIDIAGGQIGLDEALFEYKGYGPFALEGSYLDGLRKEYFKNPMRWEQDGELKSFEELFSIDRAALEKLVETIIPHHLYKEPPIYLPEVVRPFNGLTLMLDTEVHAAVAVDSSNTAAGVQRVIRYKNSEMRPYIRFLIAREIFLYLCDTEHVAAKPIISKVKEVREIQTNLFAGMLLVPSQLLLKVMGEIDGSMDLIQQLADTFWVSKSVVNQRLGDILR